MKLTMLTGVMAVFISVPAVAADLKCRAADESNGNRQSVAVTVVTGAEVVNVKETPYAGYQISVVYNKGDRFEPQTHLTLSAGDFAARTYNVSEDGLYQLLAPRLFLQCWFE